MDVIVKWRDGSQNCVLIKDLKAVKKGACINRKGTKVKMYFEKKWYYGTVVMTEIEVDSHNMPEKEMPSTKEKFSDSDEEPLSVIAKTYKNTKIPAGDEDPFEDAEDFTDPDYVISPKKRKIKNLMTQSDLTAQNKKSRKATEHQEDSYVQQCCEVNNCSGEVFSSCVLCYILLCWNHFENDMSCDGHHQGPAVVANQRTEEQNNSISSNETICMDSMAVSSAKLDNQRTEEQYNSISSNETICFDSIVVASEKQKDNIQSCEVLDCTRDVFSSCFNCQALLCIPHFENQTSCDDHLSILPVPSDFENTADSPSLMVETDFHPAQSLSLMVETDFLQDQNTFTEIESPRNILRPEHFEVEGSPREVDKTKTAKCNLKKYNKQMRNAGKEYLSSSNKNVRARQLGPICNVEVCKKFNKECYLFNEHVREDIFFDYWSQGNLQSQREFISRHMEKVPTKRKTAGPESRRQYTFGYKLCLNGILRPVCKKLFLNTLSIGERLARTTLEKTKDTGIVEKDRRGGRKEVYLEKDATSRRLIKDHINRFPRVESHYCRENTTREYLNSDLTLTKMYQMFIDEQADNTQKPCFSLYRKIFHSMNLSFHRPKKDQCGLCTSYYDGSEDVKRKLREKITNHLQEKILFRAKRSKCKKESQQKPSDIQCATFDLQQVISLPISNESAVFYKRRLSVYNFTIYDMTSGACSCYTWHEGESKRGACEISTALYQFLKKSDEKGIKKVYLFADGCSGQNKNSITACTLMYTIYNCSNIEEIVLRFSIPGHGQSEGDSAHSAINYAIKKSGNIFIPSQLIPVFKLARRNKPYEVIRLQYSDMLDFKKMSTDLKLLSLRTDNTGQKVNWTEMVKFQVFKSKPNHFFFNTSHADTISRKLYLKRNVSNVFSKDVPALHQYPPKIAVDKYNDLLSLTTGDAPVIKLNEYVEFYKSLQH